MRALLSELQPGQRESGSRRIVEWLTASDSWLENAGVVSLFGGISTEPDLLPLLPWLRERGRRAAFFAIGEAGVMRPHLVPDAAALVPGPFGVLSPEVSKCPPLDASELGIVLLPGLAFSIRNGARLGRGKGYYDRVLTRLSPGARAIGVGFSVQMIESVPREPHDVCVGSLVSEEGWRAVPSD